MAQDLPILNFSVFPIFTNFPNFQRPKVKAKGQRTKQWLNIWASSLLAPSDCFWCSWGPPDGLGGPINIFCISLIKCSIVSTEATRRPSVATRRLLTHRMRSETSWSFLAASWWPPGSLRGSTAVHDTSEIQKDLLIGPPRPTWGHQGGRQITPGGHRMVPGGYWPQGWCQCLIIWPLALIFGLKKFRKKWKRTIVKFFFSVTYLCITFLFFGILT